VRTPAGAGDWGTRWLHNQRDGPAPDPDPQASPRMDSRAEDRDLREHTIEAIPLLIQMTERDLDLACTTTAGWLDSELSEIDYG